MHVGPRGKSNYHQFDSDKIIEISKVCTVIMKLTICRSTGTDETTLKIKGKRYIWRKMYSHKKMYLCDFQNGKLSFFAF